MNPEYPGGWDKCNIKMTCKVSGCLTQHTATITHYFLQLNIGKIALLSFAYQLLSLFTSLAISKPPPPLNSFDRLNRNVPNLVVLLIERVDEHLKECNQTETDSDAMLKSLFKEGTYFKGVTEILAGQCVRRLLFVFSFSLNQDI